MKFIKGNLIELAKEGDFHIIAHGCNAFCTMGGGIALQIAQEFPEARVADNKTTRGDKTKLGKISYIDKDPTDIPYVVNVYSQFGYDRNIKQLNYNALRNGLRNLKNFALKNYEKPRIGLPLIGFGLAGGDLFRILSIIEKTFKEIDVTVVIYQDDQNADELVSICKSYINLISKLKSMNKFERIDEDDDE